MKPMSFFLACLLSASCAHPNPLHLPLKTPVKDREEQRLPITFYKQPTGDLHQQYFQEGFPTGPVKVSPAMLYRS